MGSALFGFFTAFGVTVLLLVLFGAGGAAVGMAADVEPLRVIDQVTSSSSTLSTAAWVGGIALLVILFVAYLCDGSVAAPMARFSGVKQGVAVWVWSLWMALIAAALGGLAGDRFNILKEIDSDFSVSINQTTLTTWAIIATVVVLFVGLVAAILGGLTGMRYHRKVDATGLDA